MSTPGIRGPLPQGKTATIMGSQNGASDLEGTLVKEFSLDADSILVSLFATSVAGTLDVSVSTFTEEGKEVNVITFPQVTTTSTSLVIRKAAAVMSNIRVTATAAGGAATFEVRARGIGTGEASVRILAANEAKASQTDVSTSATLLIPAALNDRAGLVIKNNNATAGNILYIGFTLAEATTGNGYPLGPLEALGIDVSAGQEVYAIGSTTIDVRILEASS